MKELAHSALNVPEGGMYFTSLVGEAYRRGIIDEAAVVSVRAQCVGLLGDRIERYTGGESSSVPVETAEMLLGGVIYTVGAGCAAFSSPEEAIGAIMSGGVRPVFISGRKRLAAKLNTARLMYSRLLPALLPLKNAAYNATVRDGLAAYFKVMRDPRRMDFKPQDNVITADYPLCIPLDHLTGVEFIERYIASLSLENAFCALFDRRMIFGLDAENDPEEIENFFEKILLLCAFCALTEGGETFPAERMRRLDVTGAQLAVLSRSAKTPTLSPGVLCAAITSRLGIKSVSMKEYIAISLRGTVKRIASAYEAGALDALLRSCRAAELS